MFRFLAIISIYKILVPVPPLFVALIVTVNIPAPIGVPLIIPVNVSILKPNGNPVAL